MENFLNSHATGCCGIRNISYLYLRNADLLSRAIEELEETFEDKVFPKAGKCVEIALTDKELLTLPWLKPFLKKHNFECVYRFQNTSSNIVNIFCRHRSPLPVSECPL